MSAEAPQQGTMPPPLAGTCVLDLSRLLPGPLCGQHLSDLGARVIKIEDPKVGDYVRPSIRRLANRGKEGLTLDLKSEEGRKIFFRLLDSADVVLESFRPGVMERLGLGYQELSRRCPSIVHCAITGYGQNGKRRSTPGHDINYLAVTGVLDQTGRKGEAPVIPGFLISDILGGTMTATMAILAALVGSRDSGRGRYIDVSMADAVIAHSVLPLAEFNEKGCVHERGTGSHTGGMPRYNVYATRDHRYIAIGAQEKKFWDTLCEAVGLPELMDKHQATDDEAARVASKLTDVFLQRDCQDWIDLLEPLDCCATAVHTYEEALSDPDFLARGTIRRSPDRPDIAMGLPFVMSGLSIEDLESPSRGQHTDAILGTLGYGSDEIEWLRDRGIV
jgi:crotonobetainyl-CoA:carnitine CoA-transferase CaiB-like acyl-CoA transferase